MASANIKIGLEDEARELLDLLRIRPQVLRVGEEDTIVLSCPGLISPESRERWEADTREITGIKNVMILAGGATVSILAKEAQ